MTTYDYEVLGVPAADVAGSIMNDPDCMVRLYETDVIKAMLGYAQHQQNGDLYERCYAELERRATNCPNCGQPASSGLHASENLRDCPVWVPGVGWRFDFGGRNYESCHDCRARLYLTDECYAVDGAIVCGPCGQARYGDRAGDYLIVR